MICNNVVIAAIKACNTKEELYFVFDSFIEKWQENCHIFSVVYELP